MRVNDLEFTGERYQPGVAVEMRLEHWHRYVIAGSLVAGMRVLDLASGEGYGSAHLARTAAHVVGVDVSSAAAAHASRLYASERVGFINADATRLPFADRSFDAVVSFETIEHIDASAQESMMGEIARVLTPAGFLLISSPNRSLYSDATGFRNEHHVHELYREELAVLIGSRFGAQRWYHQRLRHASTCIADAGEQRQVEAWMLDGDRPIAPTPDEGMYFIVLAARSGEALPTAPADLSFLIDARDEVTMRHARAESEAMRLDRLLLERDGQLLHQHRLLEEREAQVLARDRTIAGAQPRIDRAERALVAQRAEIADLDARLEAALGRAEEANRLWERQTREYNALIAERDRTIIYRQSWRWWLKLPAVRLLFLWKRLF